MSAALSEQRTPSGWHAELALRFIASGERTRMRRGTARGPLYVQKPFYPEGDLCHVYLLHPPGGIVGGDTLHLSFDVEESAHALVTTPAATKFYRSAGLPADTEQIINVAPHASFEWLPQENVLHSGSRVVSRTHVTLAPGAAFVGWELNCLGLPASKVPYSQGVLDQRFELYTRTGTGKVSPLVLERNYWAADDPVMSAHWGLGNRSVAGSLYATPMGREELVMIRKRVEDSAVLKSALTLVNGVMIARVLGDSAETARNWLADVWQQVRPLVLNRASCRPRIWNT